MASQQEKHPAWLEKSIQREGIRGEDAPDSETMDEWRAKLRETFRQMMFVSGETAEPSTETTTLIEEIVRQQVIEMVPSRELLSLSLERPLIWCSSPVALPWPRGVGPVPSLLTT